jgi:hypothetical protein
MLVLHNFYKDKSPGPNGFPMDFFIGFFDLIEEDFRRVIEESKSTRNILATYNATYL